jgi:hypothetical protein
VGIKRSSGILHSVEWEINTDISKDICAFETSVTITNPYCITPQKT